MGEGSGLPEGESFDAPDFINGRFHDHTNANIGNPVGKYYICLTTTDTRTMQPDITPALQYGGIDIFVGDITKVAADAIVNAANESLLGGGGIDGAIHYAAGPQLLAECRTLHGCPTGQSKMTGGYNLPAKHVIHTVGPDCRRMSVDEAEPLLRSCYETCLDLAEANHLESIVFCCISTGVYKFPKDRAARIALDTISARTDAGLKCKVYICCYSEGDLEVYGEVAKRIPREAFFSNKLKRYYTGETLRKAVNRVIENQDRYYLLLRSTGEPGVEELIASIHKSSFFTAHSESHHHYATGLVEHSLGVYDQMSRLAPSYGLGGKDIILTALLHDVCMARNDEWPHVSGKHGLNSCLIARKYLPNLSPAVQEAIEKHRHEPSPQNAARNPLWKLVNKADHADAATSPRNTLKFMIL